MAYAIIIIWSLWAVFAVLWLYVERNTERVWSEFSAPRDEKGRFSGRTSRSYFHLLKSGRVVPFDVIGYPFFLLLMAGCVLFFPYILA